MNKYAALIVAWAAITGLGIYHNVCEGAVIQGKTMQTKNNSGGQIVLTDRPCPGDSNARWAYTYSGTDGTMQDGCWNVLDRFIEVTWAGGSKKVYPPQIFKSVDTSK